MSNIIRDIKGGTLIRIFFIQDAHEGKEIQDIRRELEQTGYFRYIKFIDRDDAIKDFYEKNPHLKISIGDIDANPLPHSINIELNENIDDLDSVKSFLNKLEEREIIDEIVFSREWIDKFSRIIVSSKYISLSIGIALLIFSMLIIFIITNLNIYFRKEVIEIMKLIGSPYKNIKIPIIIEGLINGLLSGIISCLLLFLLINNIYTKLLELKGIFDSIIVHIDMSFYFFIIFLGGLCGVIGSLTAIEYYLYKDRKI